MLLSAARNVGAITIMAVKSVYRGLQPPYYFRETLRQMSTIGRYCLVPVLTVVVPFAMVVTLQGLEVVRLFGLERMLSSLLTVSFLREIAPGLTGIMMAAQAGSTAAAEIGTMRLKEEIDALEVMAVRPEQYLLMPRMAAFTIMCPVVNAIACLTGITGGYLTAVYLNGVTRGAFLAHLFSFISPVDIWCSILKTLLFGSTIGLLSCYHGYHATGGAEGVGRASNRAVVQSITLSLSVNFFLTTAFLAFTQ